MNSLLPLPDWVPWWVSLALIVLALFYALAFMVMPFSVMGVKPRLEAIEARLDEIGQEIRLLSMRLPAGPQELDFEDVYAPAHRAEQRAPEEKSPFDRPPIPPAVRDIYDDPEEDEGPVERPPPPPHMRPIRRQEPRIVRPARVEPRLDRPR